jgi:hypothetical protein
VARIAGHPNMNGIWQAMGTAYWNLEDHSARPRSSGSSAPSAPFRRARASSSNRGRHDSLLPAALKKRDELRAGWPKSDPEAKCYMPGIPRATYMPYPFQIVQGQKDILFVYEYASSNRIVHMQSKSEAPVDSWMGWSNGRWEGETLAITVNGFNDRPGSTARATTTPRADGRRALHAAGRERAHLRSHDDRPEDVLAAVKIRLPLYRRLEPNVQLLEFKCVEFSEELLYGDLKKK